MELQRGMRGKLGDYFDCQKDIDVLLLIDGDSEYDITCFGLDEQDKLSDDRYMIFYNQTASPQNEVKYHQEKDGIRFQVNVSKLPETIKKLVFTVSIDGTGIMHTIQSHTFDILQNGDKKLHLELTGNDFGNEKAIITAELYNKGDIWHFAVIAQGFNGGLAKLLEHFGGEEAKSNEPAPVQPVQTTPQAAETNVVSAHNEQANIKKARKRKMNLMSNQQIQKKRHDTSEDVRLIDKYVSSIENVCVYGQPLIPLLYDMITIGQKGYIDRDNLLIWKQLRNIEPSAITQKNTLSDLDIKAELNNFLLTQFTYCQRNLDWNFYAKYNFATLIIDWLGSTTFEEESSTYQRIKKVEQDIVQLNGIEQIMEYTKAFIREYDTVPDGKSTSIFAECVDSHLNAPIEDTDKFEKESANPLFHSIKKSFTSALNDISNKKTGIGTKILAGINMINPYAYIADGFNYSEVKKLDIDDLRKLSEAKLFLACGYLILRVHALASDVINTNADSKQDNDVFDFDSI